MSSQKPSEDYQKMTVQYYNENARKFIINTQHLDMTSLYEPFLSLLKPGSQILDAGCGSGRDSLYFIKHGYKVTAFDASEEMVKHASKLAGLPVQLMTFEDMNFENHFDGIWACASLLHIPKDSIDEVFARLDKALKTNGVIYVSFKYGDKEAVRNGRLFSDHNEDSFQRLIRNHTKLEVISSWKTIDVRSDREYEGWLNCLLQRRSTL